VPILPHIYFPGMLLRTALKRERSPPPHPLMPLTDDEVPAKREFVVAEILRVFEAVLFDDVIDPKSQFFDGTKHMEQKDCLWKELPWSFISIHASVPMSVLDCLRCWDVLDDALRCRGFRVVSLSSSWLSKRESIYRIVPLTVCYAKTVKELDLLWSLGLTHWKDKHFRMPQQVFKECTCILSMGDDFCVMHSHAALVECDDAPNVSWAELKRRFAVQYYNVPNATWVALRKRWTPLRGSWIAACVLAP
jgi:hypothetical protein